MPTRDQVLSALQANGGDYDTAATVLGMWPGEAYLVATGMPADGSDAYTDDELRRAGVLPGSTQHLVSRHSPPHNPTRDDEVHRWVQARAQADPAMQAAARRAEEDAT